jgi:exodeoxyribonuclease VII large subunit
MVVNLFDFQSGTDKTTDKTKDNTVVYSVGELNHYVHDVINNDPLLQGVWVRGEISNLTNHGSGHKYFTLKDAKSQLNCVMFRSSCRNLAFVPEAGMKVLAFGDIDVYEVRGNYQLVVTALKPDGVGELHKALEILKKRLAARGLFDQAHKKTLPVFPRRIGVATSPTGAVLHDIINVSKRRFPVDILLSPTVVQGENAIKSIVTSIERLNRTDVEVIILARGGGSLEDLWPFNSEEVAIAIFNSSIPVVSSIGHETDFTIADLTADVRAPTPSAAAELVVPDREDVKKQIDTNRSRLITSVRSMIDYHTNHLMHLEKIVNGARFISNLNQHVQRVDELGSRMKQIAERNLDKHKKMLEFSVGRLNAVSPLNTLKRGYSITMMDGQVVRTIDQVRKGDALEIRIIDGKIISKVLKTEEDI